MFARTLHVTFSAGSSDSAAARADQPVPLAWLDSFCMRNFTNEAIFDDTLPIADGRMEAGLLVPIAELTLAMQAWFRRKAWLPHAGTVRVTANA